jgi:hypothetical protein
MQAAFAAEAHTAPPAPPQESVSNARFGHATNKPTDMVLRIEPGMAKNFRVKRFETFRITDGTKSVTWTFDTVGTPAIPLASIFPGASGTIYVDESPLYAF